MNSYFIPSESAADEESVDYQPQKRSKLPEQAIQISNQKEDLGPYILRNLTRLGVRAGEQILGQPGNIGELLSNLRGLIQPKAEEPEGYLGRVKSFIQSRDPFKTPLEILPTSKEIRTGVKYFTDYFEPKTTGEEKADTFVQTMTNFLLPAKFLGAGAGLKTAAAATTAGMGTEELLKAYGVSPEKAKLWGGGVEIATLLKSDAPELVKTIMKRVRGSIPKTTVSSTEYVKGLEELIVSFEKGGVSDAEKKAYDLAKEQLSKAKATKGKKVFIGEGEQLLQPLELDELVALRDNINQKRFKETALGQSVLDERAKLHLDRLDRIVNNNLDLFLENPQSSNWVKDYRKAQSLAQTIHQSNVVARNISKKIKLKDLERFEPETLELLGSEVYKGFGGKFKSIYETAKLPIAKAAQFGTRFSKDPILKKYYGQVLTDGLKGYTGEAIKSLNKFDAQLKKTKKKEQFIEQTEAKTKKLKPAETDYFIPD